jgi:hypothetical protein
MEADLVPYLWIAKFPTLRRLMADVVVLDSQCYKHLDGHRWLSTTWHFLSGPSGYVYSSTPTQHHRKAPFFPAQIKEPAHNAPAHRDFAGEGEIFPYHTAKIPSSWSLLPPSVLTIYLSTYSCRRRLSPNPHPRLSRAPSISPSSSPRWTSLLRLSLWLSGLLPI